MKPLLLIMGAMCTAGLLGSQAHAVCDQMDDLKSCVTCYGGSVTWKGRLIFDEKFVAKCPDCCSAHVSPTVKIEEFEDGSLRCVQWGVGQYNDMFIAHWFAKGGQDAPWIRIPQAGWGGVCSPSQIPE